MNDVLFVFGVDKKLLLIFSIFLISSLNFKKIKMDFYFKILH